LRPAQLIDPQEATETPDASSADVASAEDALTGGEDRTTILVVDDNAELRRLVRRQLASDYRVIESTDGREALDQIRKALPDLVISDIMMPRLDGIGLCQAIRGDPQIDFVPVVLLTARASADSRIEGLDEGADAYLAKPFNGGVLRATVANLLASRRRLRDRFAAAAALSVPGAVAEVAAADCELTAPPDADESYLQRLRLCIRSHLHDEEFSVDDLAHVMHQSRVSLYRYCKRLSEASPSDLIREERLARAAHLLANGEGSVSEVGYAVGFKSTAHFSNSFRARFGARPSEWLHSARRASTDAAVAS
jgi:DNA-binding response OmpR family regulator